MWDGRERLFSLSKTFADLGLDARILKALASIHHTEPTAIQAGAVPPAIAGQDILGCAQTGTGKTAGFALPVLHRLAAQRSTGRGPRALVLAPTRELAAQIFECFRCLGQNLPLRYGLLIGGVGMGPQEGMLRRGVDVLIATPGRLKDHIDRRSAQLGQVEMLVLDEADRMLDMGFIKDVRALVRMCREDRQTLLFSATLPPPILQLAHELLTDHELVEVASRSSTPQSVTQMMFPIMSADKRNALLKLLDDEAVTQAIIFARTKHGADKLGKFLDAAGFASVILHGNKTQAQRRQALERFKGGRASILVATDIAARGIDVQGVSHVINFDAPQAPEDYVHRIGRTGRAQATGVAWSLVGETERSMMRSIERLTQSPIPVTHLEGFARPPEHAPRSTGGRGGSPRRRFGGGGGGRFRAA
jgi:ATP-dependent RNA helicase RhlE